MSKSIWCGCVGYGRWEVFRSENAPTKETHGDKYLYCVGPFRTVRGARFWSTKSTGNPHCVTVADAERLGKKYNC